MTSAHDFHLSDFTSEIIQLNTFSEFLSYSYVTSKLSIYPITLSILKD